MGSGLAASRRARVTSVEASVGTTSIGCASNKRCSGRNIPDKRTLATATLLTLVLAGSAPAQTPGVTATFFLSISLLVGMVVGGNRLHHGRGLRRDLHRLIPNLADQLTKAAPWAIHGLLLLACIYAMPKGVAGPLQLIWVRMNRRA
jgi:hypothetical protein